MRKLILLSILLLFSPVFAASCQYVDYETEKIGVEFVPVDNNGKELDELIIEVSPDWNKPATIINPNGEDISARISLNLNVKEVQWCKGPGQQIDYSLSYDINISARDSSSIPTIKPMNNHYCNDFKWDKIESVEYLDNGIVRQELRDIFVDNEICLGVNDGFSCSNDAECGSGSCVKNICSPDNNCFENDCGCAEDEVQCSSNSCVKQNIVPLDVKPSCGLSSECESGYMNELGVCEESPSVIAARAAEQDKYNKKLLVAGLLIVFVSLIFIYRERRKLVEVKLKIMLKQIHRDNTEINRLKNKTDKTEAERKRLRNTRKKFEKEKSEFKEKSEKFHFEKLKERYGDQIKLDSKGYVIFSASGKSYARWIYESHYGKIKRGYHLHHIDHNKYNNEIWNLMILPFSVHNYRIKHGRIIVGDFESGILELKRIGKKYEDLPKKVRKHIDKEELADIFD